MMESSRSLRVAVIDENAGNLNAFTRILEKIGGVEPLTFSSAPAALTQLAETDVSLLIMDHHLPPVDGDEVITKFRALTGKADVPVLVVSDDPAPESRHRMVERGARDRKDWAGGHDSKGDPDDAHGCGLERGERRSLLAGRRRDRQGDRRSEPRDP